MVREPPLRRNDAALLSKIASQEKLRAELPPLSSERAPFVPEHPLPRATAWFLLQESIRWLQESGRFYVKILQKIMARYIYFPPALRLLVALHSCPFPFSYIVLCFFDPTSCLFPSCSSRVRIFGSSRPNYHAPRVHPSNCISTIGLDSREEIGRKVIYPGGR